jgi:hypothetical protein
MSDAPDPSRLERLIAALLALLADRQATIEELRQELEELKDEEE